MSIRYPNYLLSILAATCLSTACGTTNDTTTATNSVPPSNSNAATPIAVVDDPSARVAQISVANGIVSLRPSDVEEWTQADINQPVFEGSELFADNNSSGEVVLGDNRYVRFTDGADLEFTQLDAENVQLDVTDGTVTLDVDNLGPSERYELNTPGGAILASTGGEFRVDIDNNGDTWLTVHRGTAQVSTPNGSFDLAEGDRVNLSVVDPSAVEVVSYDRTTPPDAWDRWNNERRDYYTSFAVENEPAPVRELRGRRDIYGLGALSAAGQWRARDDGRYVWHPKVQRDWSPYQNGYWNYAPRVGWTWISRDSWGWAPYHYGRWDHDDRNGWYWSPSDGVSNDDDARQGGRHRWRPANVYTFQAKNSKRVMWVPLAYGEPEVAYSQAWRDNNVPQNQADFVPRHLRERRGIAYVSDDGFNRRERARRADRRDFDGLESYDGVRPAMYVVPKPGRVVPEDRVARIRPRADIRGRGVVVRSDELDDHRAHRRSAREDRPIRKADSKRLEARRSDRDHDGYRDRDRDRKGDRDGDRDRDRKGDRDGDRDRDRKGP